MARKQRIGTTFSLSFLDIMSCGLGATVLLFLIVRHNIDPVVQVSTDLNAETEMLQEEIRIGEENLVRIRNTISDIDDQLAQATGLARQIQDEIENLQRQIEQLDPNAVESLAELEQRLAELESQRSLLQQAGGDRVRQYVGEGQRQYLTGIKMGGQRTLILVDRSASMLDETIVNVVIRRNQSDEIKRQSPKWQQAVDIADWIITNLEPDTRFQLYSFNVEAESTVPGTTDSWLPVSEEVVLNGAIQGLRGQLPEKGTSLINVFSRISNLNPQPDNIFLITDGLPTQGKLLLTNGSVSGRERVAYFNEALDELGQNIPVNVLLLPMEGDYFAASAFWTMAVRTRGSFLTPSRDWP
ncbi:MAG: VWA domain-containing protein [Porticoccaceae bacterium]|jgi:hypothetical protein|nr:VWA domain-containing protein [Porticoccaceae bacterium]